MLDNSAGIAVVGRDFLGDFVCVTAIGATLIVRNDRARGLELVIDFRDRHDKSMPGEKRRRAADGGGYLKNLGKESQPRIAPLSCGTQNVCSHWPRRSWQIDDFLVSDNHDAA